MMRTKRLNYVYVLFGSAKALVSVFGPIYLLQSGFSLPDILFYCILVALVKVASLWAVFPLAARYGAHATMLVGVGVMAAHFAWFAVTQQSYVWLGMLAALLGLANAFFYPSFRILFAQQTDKRSISAGVAKQNIYLTLVSAILPVIGGGIATLFDMRATYVLAAVTFVCTAYYGYRFVSRGASFTFHMRRIPRGKALRDYTANASYSMSGLADIAVWSLYVAMIIPTYAGIGAYTGFVVAATVVMQLLVGRYVDNHRAERSFLYVGIGLNVLYNAGRALASSISQLVGLGVAGSLGGAMLSGAYGGRFYKNIHPQKQFEYLFAMELANSVTWLIYFPILYGASFVVSDDMVLRIGILLVIPAALGMAFVRMSSHKA